MPWSLSKTIKKHKSTTNFLVRDCTFVSEVSLEPRPDKSLIGKQFWLFWLKIPYPSIKPRLTACHINKPIVGANLKSLESQNALLYFHYFQSDKVMKWERLTDLNAIWRQSNTSVFPACWILIDQLQFQAHRSYHRLPLRMGPVSYENEMRDSSTDGIKSKRKNALQVLTWQIQTWW